MSDIEERVTILEASLISLLERLERAPEKPFTREEVRDLMARAVGTARRLDGETSYGVAERVLREAGR